MFISGLGAIFFGLVIGWITYRTLRLTSDTNIFAIIAIIIAVVGGGAVTALLKNDVVFGWYTIGLAVGFFAYFGIGLRLYGKRELQLWQMPPADSSTIPPDANPMDAGS